MGIFDLFRKENAVIDVPDNVLEVLLKKAATQPEFRAEFYEKLLSENLVVIGRSDEGSEGEHILQKDTKVNISGWPDGRIPFFTSTNRIFDKGVVKERVPFIKMKGEDFFTLTKDSALILNPYSDYGKEFLPDEVARMLSGIIMSPDKQIITEKDMPVQIGQPMVYPVEIVSALKQLFVKKPDVSAGYLGWIYLPESGEPAHYIFAIEANGDFTKIQNDAGFIAKQFLKDGEFVDFIRIDNNGGISDYFLKETKPFYQK